MWVREPSIEVCAVECGAKCCKAPGYLPLRWDELDRLDEHFPKGTILRGRVESERGVHITTETDHIYLVFEENGGQCPNLKPDNSCGIWHIRPDACRRFPEAPHDGCLVWPTSGTATE